MATHSQEQLSEVSHLASAGSRAASPPAPPPAVRVATLGEGRFELPV